jgi:hypothetical protein
MIWWLAAAQFKAGNLFQRDQRPFVVRKRSLPTGVVVSSA